MKHFINIRDISSKNLKKIILDAKKRKSRRKNLNTLDTRQRFTFERKTINSNV